MLEQLAILIVWPAWMHDSNWWVVIIAGFTGVVICWQSWETRKSARAARESVSAMEHQISLQETLSQQWVEITGWRKEGFGSRELDPPRFTIAAEISNPTQAPLTIRKVYIGAPGKPLAEYEIESVLAPGAEAVKITYSDAVEPQMTSVYDMGQFPFVIQGRVIFTDCFGKDRSHPFRRGCFLGPGSRFHSLAISELTIPIPDPRIDRTQNQA